MGEKIKILSDIDHILLRPGMYIGSVELSEKNAHFLENGKMKERTIKYSQGLDKIINELIDNSIDEFVRTKGKFGNKLDIKVNETSFYLKDNGRGIPVIEMNDLNGDKIFQPVAAWTKTKAGSNFGDGDSTTIGTNGVGSSLSNIFSKKFTAISRDGKKACKIECADNLKTTKVKISKTDKKGVEILMEPDFSKFGTKNINKTQIDLLKQRSIQLMVAYPGLNINFNGEKLKIDSKNFLESFGKDGVLIEEKGKYAVYVLPSLEDEFKQFTLMNGLTLEDGGSHMQYLVENVVGGLKDRIIKKYKTIKYGDVKNKLRIIAIMRDFNNPKYETQNKTKLTNSQKEVSTYFNINFDPIIKKIAKTEIYNNIVDYFKIKESFQAKKELAKLDKGKKRIISSKYTKGIGKNDYLFIGEGYSAISALSGILGRRGFSYYELKGKVLNVMKSPGDFLKNQELTELYKIIKNEGFNKIVIATDADLDGYSITGLLLTFFHCIMPEILENDKVYFLRTPIAVASNKKKEITKWAYDIKDVGNLKGVISYKKGLGSWNKKDLNHIIDKDGFKNMTEPLTYGEEDKKSIINWFSGETVEFRKKQITSNTEFSIVKL